MKIVAIIMHPRQGPKDRGVADMQIGGYISIFTQYGYSMYWVCTEFLKDSCMGACACTKKIEVAAKIGFLNALCHACAMAGAWKYAWAHTQAHDSINDLLA